MRGLAASSDPTPASRAVWLDAAEDDALVGWLYWPDADGFTAEVNGQQVALEVELCSRSDVPAVIGVEGPVHAIRILADVVTLMAIDDIRIAISSGDASLEVWRGPAGELLAEMIPRAWPNITPPIVASAIATGLRCRAAPAGLANGASVQGTQAEPTPSWFFSGNYNVGPRFDLPVCRFQEHVYFRHVRDHAAFRTVRHYPAATRAGTVDFLVWSLRSFAGNYPFAPLPAGSSDLELLNRPEPATGLAKGFGPGVMLSRITLTAAQAAFIHQRHGRTEASSEDELADWLVEWLGSWGWGHRGLRLVTPQQLAFIHAAPIDAYQSGSLGAISQPNRYSLARLREHSTLRDSYPAMHLPHVRLAFLLELLSGELRDIGSDALVPTQFLDWVTRPGAFPTVAGTSDHSSRTTSPAAQLHDAASVPPLQRVPVRVIGMLDSRSGLGQNTRNSVRALELAGLGPATYSLAVNDRSVTRSHGQLLAAGPAQLNIWHMNPDNIPEAVCTVDPSLYESSYNIGFFAWELDRQPRGHQLAIDWVDEIWVPSHYCAESFRSVTSKPIQVMPHAVEIPDDLSPWPRHLLGLGSQHFLVHISFDLHSWPPRKNPLAAIRAFQTAFVDDDARLLLKIRNGSGIGIVDSDADGLGDAVLELADSDDRIIVDVMERSYADTMAMLKTADCHLSLHRSEGFGYTLAESLTLGVPLVCSDYSGSQDFCTTDNAWLVPVTERLVREGEYYLAPPGARWGEPDVNAAVEHLRAIRAGDDRVATRIANGLTRAGELTIRDMSVLYGKRIGEILR